MLAGEFDPMAPLADVRAFVARLRTDAELVVVEDRGHVEFARSDPDDFGRAFERVLGRSAPAGTR